MRRRRLIEFSWSYISLAAGGRTTVNKEGEGISGIVLLLEGTARAGFPAEVVEQGTALLLEPGETWDLEAVTDIRYHFAEFTGD